MKSIGNHTTQVFLAVAVSAATMSIAHAELVYDDEVAARSDRQTETRDDMRKSYKTTQQVEVANEISVSSTPAVITEAPATSRSELLRRKRMREEINNEDLLTQRLEELRLREEEKRTKKIMKSTGLSDEDAEVATAREMSPAPVIVETKIQAPITEKAPESSTQMSAAPAVSPQMQQAQMSPISSDRLGYSQSMHSGASISATESSRAHTPLLSVSPRLGIASISNNYYEFRSRYAAGLALTAAVSEFLSMELGYTYSQNSIGLPSYGNPYQELNYNQNLFDLGMKLHFTSHTAAVRPYVAGGAGYSMGFINYDQRTQAQLRASYMSSQDYELNQIVGAVGGGLEFKVGGNASIGVGYKLIVPVATTQEQPLYHWAFYQNPNQMMQDSVRGSLRDSRTQMFLVNGTFSF